MDRTVRLPTACTAALKALRASQAAASDDREARTATVEMLEEQMPLALANDE